MALVDDGKNRIRDLLADDLDKGQWGTGTTPVADSDTGLETAVSATNLALTTSKTDKQILMDHNLNNATGNGNSLTEFGITLNSGTDFLSRVVIDGLTKQNTEQWQTTTIVFIE